MEEDDDRCIGGEYSPVSDPEQEARENVEEKRVGMGTTFALKYKVLG